MRHQLSMRISMRIAQILLLVVVLGIPAQQRATAAANAGMIAYTNGSQIRLIAPDGSGDRPIWTVPDPQHDHINDLSWRPDAGEIAFSSDHAATHSRFESDIYAIRPDGGGLRKLTNAPDGSTLAGYPHGSVTITIGNGQADAGPFLIYVEGAQAAQSVTLTPGSIRTLTFDNVADFGSIGQAIVAINGSYRWVKPGVVDIRAASLVSAGTFVIEGDGMRPFGAYSPTWRSDGSSVGFIFGGCVGMYAVAANPPLGGSETPLLNTDLVNPCLAVRAPTAALANQVLYGVYGYGGGEIDLVSEGSADAGVKLITYDTPDMLLGLSWLPDGSGFVFSKTADFDARANIYAYDFATHSVTQLTQFVDAFAGSVSVSPDGQSIVFERAASLHESTTELWIMARAGGNARRLVSNGGRPAWSASTPVKAPSLLSFRVYLARIAR